jgi:hypothetical protein
MRMLLLTTIGTGLLAGCVSDRPTNRAEAYTRLLADIIAIEVTLEVAELTDAQLARRIATFTRLEQTTSGIQSNLQSYRLALESERASRN